MTPAIALLEKSGISHQIHEYKHDGKPSSYGLEAAQKLGIEASRVFKTLVVQLDNNQLAVAILPVDRLLNMKQAAKALGAKKAEMAEAAKVQRVTGYVLGGVSPLGQKKSLTTVIDQSAQDHSSIYVSAGRRGLEIELSAQALLTLSNGQFAALCQSS
jgi:Cys-tRNA(Pro)/Cys-tRNA(Cys) deacylase